MDTDYSGKVAVITGAGRGLGKAFATELARRGATVALIDLDIEAASEAAAEIGTSAIPFEGDVTHESRMREVMANIATRHGGIDILINNAGLHSLEYSRPVEELGIAKVRRMFDVNIMGTLTVTMTASSYMMDRPGANIVNISSSAAFQPGGYGTSKLAVIGLTMTFARELARHGIRVNAIAPGIILTETIKRELPDDLISQIKALQFLKVEGEEEDIVSSMLFLTSKHAKFITGETLRVTGGYTAAV